MSIRRASGNVLYRHNNHLNANLRHIRRISSAVFSGLGFHACELVGTHSLRVSFSSPGAFRRARASGIVLSNFSVVIVGPRGPRQHGRRRLRGAIVDGLHQALVVNRQRRAWRTSGLSSGGLAVLKASRAMFIPGAASGAGAGRHAGSSTGWRPASTSHSPVSSFDRRPVPPEPRSTTTGASTVCRASSRGGAAGEHIVRSGNRIAGTGRCQPAGDPVARRSSCVKRAAYSAEVIDA